MTLRISKPDIITKMTQVFNKDVISLIIFNNPATLNKYILSNQEIDTKIQYDVHKRYRSGIGSLLYLVKHSQPKLSNAVHELYKCMGKSNMSHYKSLLRSIKYIIYKKILPPDETRCKPQWTMEIVWSQ